MLVPDQAWALAAALLWATSSQVVSRGLSALRSRAGAHTPLTMHVIDVMVAVLLAIVGGVASLLLVSAFDVRLVVDVRVAAAGLLTFPIGTGLYYVTALAYGVRADLASQFANVKPLFSITLAALVFREALGPSDLVAVGVIAVGVTLLFIAAGSRTGSGGRASLALGLGLAAAWAGGEGFVRAVAADIRPVDIAFSGLVVSGVVVILVLLGLAVRGRWDGAATTMSRRALVLLPSRAHAAFLLHGVLSFGFAYALLFQSIATIGLARSAMVTAFWPALAVALGVWVSRRSGARQPLPGGFQVAGFALFLLGSLISLLG